MLYNPFNFQSNGNWDTDGLYWCNEFYTKKPVWTGLNQFHGLQNTGPRWSGLVPTISGSVLDHLQFMVACFGGKKPDWTGLANTSCWWVADTHCHWWVVVLGIHCCWCMVVMGSLHGLSMVVVGSCGWWWVCLSPFVGSGGGPFLLLHCHVALSMCSCGLLLSAIRGLCWWWKMTLFDMAPARHSFTFWGQWHGIARSFMSHYSVLWWLWVIEDDSV